MLQFVRGTYLIEKWQTNQLNWIFIRLLSHRFASEMSAGWKSTELGEWLFWRFWGPQIVSSSATSLPTFHRLGNFEFKEFTQNTKFPITKPEFAILNLKISTAFLTAHWRITRIAWVVSTPLLKLWDTETVRARVLKVCRCDTFRQNF
jgi:hypothetical protein